MKELPPIVRNLPLVFVLGHTAIVVTVAAAVAACGAGESVLLWNILMVMDSPLVLILRYLFNPIEMWSQATFGHAFTYTIGYAVFFGITGAIQYYIVVRAIIWFVVRLAAKKSQILRS